MVLMVNIGLVFDGCMYALDLGTMLDIYNADVL